MRKPPSWTAAAVKGCTGEIGCGDTHDEPGTSSDEWCTLGDDGEGLNTRASSLFGLGLGTARACGAGRSLPSAAYDAWASMRRILFCVALALLTAQGCGGSSNSVSGEPDGGGGDASSSSSSSGSSSGSAGGSGSGGSGGDSGAESSGGGTDGGSGGGDGSAGNDGGAHDGGACKSGKPTSTELQPCHHDSDCVCGQVCVADPAFADNPTAKACETVCQSNAECPNAATLCSGKLGPAGGKTCEVNLCTQSIGSPDELVGTACDSSGTGAKDGTCVPQDSGTGADFVVCMPNGTAKSCKPSTDDNPWTTTNYDSSGMTSLHVESPQPRTGSSFCPAGEGCQVPANATSGSCNVLCAPDLSSNHCPTNQVCLSQDSYTWWGFCGTCRAKGQPCNIDSDCCSKSCNFANDSVCN